jgi:hypothetical protein
VLACYDVQADLGSISSEIKNLQEQSMSMGIKLRNRKVAEVRLARFVEEMVVPPNMIDTIVDGKRGILEGPSDSKQEIDLCC